MALDVNGYIREIAEELMRVQQTLKAASALAPNKDVSQALTLLRNYAAQIEVSLVAMKRIGGDQQLRGRPSKWLIEARRAAQQEREATTKEKVQAAKGGIHDA
jgi:hypothetical protein